jgi:hypothetical protein
MSMATDTITPKEIIIIINGKEHRVTGIVVAPILYLADHAAFFNDPRTMGNFMLMEKEAKISYKNEMVMTA